MELAINNQHLFSHVLLIFIAIGGESVHKVGDRKLESRLIGRK